MGMKIDGGRFGAGIDEAIALADGGGFRKRRAQSKKAGLLRGTGYRLLPRNLPRRCRASSCPRRSSRTAPCRWRSARSPTARATRPPIRRKSRPTFRPKLIAAFRFSEGDTDLLPGGNGHGGARSMHMGGTALVMAVEQLIEKGRRIAAHLLQAPVEQVSFADGRFVVQGTGRAIAIGKVADAARDPANLPDGLTQGLEGHAKNESELYTFPNGCHVAEVEIDPDTGVVRLDRYTIADDFGRLVNPRVALGQVHGGVAQGIGQALLEHVVLRPRGPASSPAHSWTKRCRARRICRNSAGGLNDQEPTFGRTRRAWKEPGKLAPWPRCKPS